MNVELFRKNYREKEIKENYNGWRHFSFTVLGTIIPIILAFSFLKNVTRVEWLTVPLTFLYANIVEYFGHRGPMHHPVKFLGVIFQRHTLEHHKYYTHEFMEAEDSRDFKMVLFPPVMLIFFIAGFAVPVSAILYFFVSPNVGLLFAGTALAYFLNYELFHWAYHQPAGSWVYKVPGINRFRRLHLNHHNPGLMTRYNFNITYPIGDRIFKTLKLF